MALDKWEKAHWRRVGKYQRELEELYDKILKEVAKMGASIKPFFKANKALNIEDYPQAVRQLQKLLDELNSGVTATIQNGIELEWDYSNRKNDEVLRELFGERFEKLTRDQKRRYFSTNGKALDAFIKRKDNNGLGLSDKVWRYTGQFKEEVEMALDLGIRDGVPAAKMAMELKRYLQNPDKLFRRVRDEHGILQLSKNAKAFHPGRGVYRSSYKNAMRLARTETNMAYRSADHERWKNMDFVSGIEVKLSNNHTLNGVPFVDMCDDLKGIYPKTFKFTGWHPQCRCHAVPIFAQSFDEFLDDKIEELKTGKKVVRDKKEVKDLPKGFKEYIAKNKDRIERSRERGKLPYFIRDNFEVGNGGVLKPFDTKPSVLELAKQRQARRTAADIADIKHRWNERRAIRKYGNSILSYMAGISDVDTSLLNSALMGGDLAKIEVEARKLKDVGKKILALDKLDNPMQVARQFSMQEAIAVNEAVEKKLKTFNWKNIDEVISKLEFEISWVERHKKYSTWSVARGAYKKALQNARIEKRYKDAQSTLVSLREYKTKSSRYIKQLELAEKAIKAKDMDGFDKIVEEAEGIRTSLLKASIKRKRKGLVCCSNYETLDELRQRMGAEMPDTLRHLDKKIADFSKTSGFGREARMYQDEIEEVMRDVFEKHDYGMNIRESVLDSILNSHFKNTFETGTSGGYLGGTATTGKIPKNHARLGAAHKLFGLGSTKNQLPRSSYEKYGNLLDHNIKESLSKNTATQYGRVEVRFKKELVNPTWTAGDSLGGRWQPSLAKDPKAVSFDAVENIPRRGTKTDDLARFKRDHISRYIELQYHGHLTPDMVESLAFPYDITMKMDVLKSAIRWKNRGAKIYYIKNGNLVEL